MRTSCVPLTSYEFASICSAPTHRTYFEAAIKAGAMKSTARAARTGSRCNIRWVGWWGDLEIVVLTKAWLIAAWHSPLGPLWLFLAGAARDDCRRAQTGLCEEERPLLAGELACEGVGLLRTALTHHSSTHHAFQHLRLAVHAGRLAARGHDHRLHAPLYHLWRGSRRRPQLPVTIIHSAQARALLHDVQTDTRNGWKTTAAQMQTISSSLMSSLVVRFRVGEA